MMQYDVHSVEEYIAELPEDRKYVIEKLRNTIRSSLPNGFEEQILHGMINYVVPLSRYPQGYHVNKNEPLTFLAITSQKNHVALYHMGLYSVQEIADWFSCEYTQHMPTKLDMGKSSVRFQNHP